MCGRYNLRTTPQAIADLFAIGRQQVLDFSPRYNIAPTQNSLIVRQANGVREVCLARWGLIPSWAKDSKGTQPLINARAETLTEKASFRTAFKKQRCLVPASGFYEWQRVGREKHPFHIHREDDSLLAFAGLWESWNQGTQQIDSFTIITCQANSQMASLHDRMPVLVPPETFGIWMDHDIPEVELQSLLQPVDWQDVVITEVAPLVNSVRNESPDCVMPIPPAA